MVRRHLRHREADLDTLGAFAASCAANVTGSTRRRRCRRSGARPARAFHAERIAEARLAQRLLDDLLVHRGVHRRRKQEVAEFHQGTLSRFPPSRILLPSGRVPDAGAEIPPGGHNALPPVRPDWTFGVRGWLRLLADGGRPLRSDRGRPGRQGHPSGPRPRRQLRGHRAGLWRRSLRRGRRARPCGAARGRHPRHQVRREGPPASRAPARREPRQYLARGRRDSKRLDTDCGRSSSTGRTRARRSRTR